MPGPSIRSQSEVETDNLLIRAQRRRRALTTSGISTYELSDIGQESIRCLCCGYVSFNPNDIEKRYCGFCHEWHSEELPA